MPLVINTNIGSLNAQRNLVKSGLEMSTAMERLSSGLRINTAADDAAGLALTNRMTSQIRGLDQAVRNANDGISMISTAEGALQEATNILQRMRELAIQSSNGIYSDADRATLNAEVQQLKSELDRISDTTSFNGQKLLDGTQKNISLQVGAETGETVDFGIESFNTNSLGGSGGDLVLEASTGLAALSAFTAATTDLALVVNDVTLSSLADAAAGSSLNDKLASMNSDLDGKGVEVSALVSMEATNAGDGQLVEGTDTLTLTVLAGDGTTQTYAITGTNSMNDLVDKINSDTNITASLSDTGKLVLSQENVVSITASGTGDGLTASGLSATEADRFFRLAFTSTNGDPVKVEKGDGFATETLIGAIGLNYMDDNGNTAGLDITGVVANSLNEGDLIINGVEIGAIDGNATVTTSVANTVEAINKKSSETGVVAYVVTGETLKIALSSTTGSLSIKYGDNANATNVLAMTGLQEQNAQKGAGSVGGVDVSTYAGAQKAITTLASALDQVNAQRADLGAITNRLNYTVSNLMNVSENISASRSRILDADFAQETANLSRTQVLQQATSAMLAQANAAPQLVLSLLR